MSLSPARRSLALTLAAVLGLGLVVGVAPARADARDAFKEAMDHVEARDWQAAEEKLREAVRLDPQEDKRTFVKDYLPHYWLGVALQEQDDCRGAVASFEESQRQGVATDSGDADDLSARLSRCRGVLADLDEALAQAEDAVAKAREADETLARMSSSPELAAHWAPFENRRQAALGKLAEAERLAARGHDNQDLAPMRQASDDASQVTSQLLTIAADARAKAGQVSAASDRAQGDLEEAETQASTALRAVQTLEPLPPELGEQAAGLRRLLGQTQAVKSSGDSRRMRDLSRQIVESVRLLKNLAASPPDWLMRAAQKYLDLEYAAALADVERRLGRPVTPPDGSSEGGEPLAAQEPEFSADDLAPRERFHALLLAAAARHQLWVASGESNAAAFDQLRADLDAAAALQAEALADRRPSLGRAGTRFLSPSLRALWAEALLEAGVDVPQGDDPASPEG